MRLVLVQEEDSAFIERSCKVPDVGIEHCIASVETWQIRIEYAFLPSFALQHWMRCSLLECVWGMPVRAGALFDGRPALKYDPFQVLERADSLLVEPSNLLSRASKHAHACIEADSPSCKANPLSMGSFSDARPHICCIFPLTATKLESWGEERNGCDSTGTLIGVVMIVTGA